MIRLSRREWCAGIAATAVGRYRPVLAAQIYVWTQQFDREHRTLADGIGDALVATRAAGFRRIELTSAMFTPEVGPRTFAGLERSGMEVPIVYTGGAMHEEATAQKSIASILALAGTVKRTGCRVLNLNPDPKPGGAAKTDDELAVQARMVTELSEALAKLRFQLIMHHHRPEMLNNAREWWHLLRNTKVPLCLDTDWVRRGGQEPLALAAEAGSRVRSIHLRNSVDGVWSESFGDGDIDYRKLAAQLRAASWGGYLVVELAYEGKTAITRSLEEDLRLSRQYAESVFGVEG